MIYSQSSVCSSHSGLIIYVKSSHHVKSRDILKSSVLWESLFLEVTLADNRKIIIGNVHRTPREEVNKITTLITICSSTHTLKSNEISRLCGDFNSNLLKIHEQNSYEEFFLI